MDSSDSLHLDEHLARLLAAYDQGMEHADGHAATIDLPSIEGGERRVDSLSGSKLNQGSLNDLLPDASRSDPFATPHPGPPSEVHRVGRFELRRQLGRGGCGIVFLAHDPKLKRDVALKIPRPELMLSPDARKRLVREATAAAAFDHPNLVPVYETGEIGPVCFIATVFCPGLTLSEWLERQAFPVPVRQAARLVAQLAEAVQHAHDRGVLHRDLKPNNVILQEVKTDPQQQEAPAGACPLRGDYYTPRVVDFGLAKLADQGPGETATRQVLGTPKYMAPEQAQAKHEDVGPEADVYALGGILYEMLTGRAPYEGATDVEVLRLCIEGNLTQPRSLRKDIPRDLEAICIKALAKTPTRRYRSAIDFSDDLRRFLDGLPTLARPLKFVGRASRWLRRNDQLFALVTVSTICLVLLTTGLFNAYETQKLQTYQDQTQLQEAERTKQEQSRNYVRFVREAFYLWRAGQREPMQRSLLEAKYAIGVSGASPEFTTAFLTNRWKQPGGLVAGSPNQVRSVAVDPAGTRIATGHADGTVRIWTVNPIRPGTAVKAQDHAVDRIAWLNESRVATERGTWDIAPDGALRPVGLAEMPARGVLVNRGPAAWRTARIGNAEIQLLDETGRSVQTLPTGPLRAAAASRHAPLIAVVSEDESLSIWNVETGARQTFRGLTPQAHDLSFLNRTLLIAAEDGLHSLNDDADPFGVVLADRPDAVTAIATPSGGPAFATAYRDGSVELFTDRASPPKRFPANGRGPISILEHQESGPVLGVEIGSDHVSVWEFGDIPKLKLKRSVKSTAAALTTAGDSLAIADERGRITAWSLTSGQVLGTIDSNHTRPVGCLAFSANGRWLALPIEGTSVGIWFVGESTIPLKVAGHPEGTHRFRFLGDDRLVSAGLGSSLKTWNLSTLREELSLLGHSARVSCLTASPDFRTLVSGSTDGEVRFWDLRTGQELIAASRHRGPVFAAEFAGDSRFLLTGSGLRGRGELAFWDAEVE